MTGHPGLLPEGLHDRLPPEAETLGRMRRAVLGVAELNGYVRVDPPLAEYETTLLRRLKFSRSADLLRVIDPISQRSLAFRPDITAQVGRIAVTCLAHRPRPLRLCYAGQVLIQACCLPVLYAVRIPSSAVSKPFSPLIAVRLAKLFVPRHQQYWPSSIEFHQAHKPRKRPGA